MQLNQPFLKLPIKLCGDTLAAEVRALPKSAWEPHPQRFAGNEALPLITPCGQISNGFSGPMAPTEYLQHCPYIMEIMAEIGATWGRSRLMGLGPKANVPPHIDIHYYWRTHFRLHIPVITNPDVVFNCGDETLHMKTGECWVLDTFRRHGVENRGSDQRIHLVLDTVGGERLWELMAAAEAGDASVRRLEPGQGKPSELAFEQINLPKVMSPWEIRCHLAVIGQEMVDAPDAAKVAARLEKFTVAWAAAWARFGESDAGAPTYRDLIAQARADLRNLGADRILLSNGRTLLLVVETLVLANAIAGPAIPEHVQWGLQQPRLRAS